MATITVTGLKELVTELGRIENPLPKQQLVASFMDAADYVAVRARAKVPTGPSNRAAGSIKATATTAGAYVLGGSGVPYYGWLEFGTREPVIGNPRKKGPWKGSGRGPVKGRYLYPTAEENEDRIVEFVAKGIDSLIRDAGLG
jgi:hypothetical protein